MTRTANFTVTGGQEIHCEGCEQRIGRALMRLDGVESAEASVEGQRVVVEFDPEKVATNELRDRLDLLGYEAAGGDTA